MAVSLRGHAQGVYGNLSGKSHNYEELVLALKERFAPPNQTELYRVQLRERRQRAAETLSELAQDIRRLTNLAYPTAPSDVRETLAKEQFVDSLVSSDMRLRIKQAQPSNLNDAVRHAVELEAFNRAERKHQEGQGYLMATNKSNSTEGKEITELKRMIEEMRRNFELLLKDQNKESRQNFERRNQDTNFTRERGQPNREQRFQRKTQEQKRKCFEGGSDQHFKI